MAKVLLQWRAELRAMQPRPLRITLTWLSPASRRKLDNDNRARALKGVRDAVAEVLGIDDGDERQAVWRTREGADPVGDGAVLLSIRSATHPVQPA